MAVQLLEEWLRKEQEKIQTSYRELNQHPLKEPDVIFIGDSIIEYYPITELFRTSKQLVNRGIRGYTSDLLRDYIDAHVFGTAVDKIFILIGTNDIGKEIPQEQSLANLEAIFHYIASELPLAQIKLLSILPVNEGETYKDKVHLRSNAKIQQLNQAYQDLCARYIYADYVDVAPVLMDETGNLRAEYTTDGLHLTVVGYRALSQELQKDL